MLNEHFEHSSRCEFGMLVRRAALRMFAADPPVCSTLPRVRVGLVSVSGDVWRLNPSHVTPQSAQSPASSRHRIANYLPAQTRSGGLARDAGLAWQLCRRWVQRCGEMWGDESWGSSPGVGVPVSKV